MTTIPSAVTVRGCNLVMDVHKRHPGQVLSKSRLAEHVYDFDAERDSNVLEVYINRLRRKFGRDLIATRRGQGYVFGIEDG